MIMPDPAFNQIVLDAQNRADKMGDEYLSAEHLLLSLAAVTSDAQGDSAASIPSRRSRLRRP